MQAVLIWIVTSAVSLLLLFLIIRAAINNSVILDIHNELRHISSVQSRQEKAIEKLTAEVAQLRKAAGANRE